MAPRCQRRLDPPHRRRRRGPRSPCRSQRQHLLPPPTRERARPPLRFHPVRSPGLPRSSLPPFPPRDARTPRRHLQTAPKTRESSDQTACTKCARSAWATEPWCIIARLPCAIHVVDSRSSLDRVSYGVDPSRSGNSVSVSVTTSDVYFAHPGRYLIKTTRSRCRPARLRWKPSDRATR